MAMNTNLNRLAKSLRLLIETAKHVGVPSYERLAEASFGKMGFNTISFAMFIMSYGAMVGYMIIIKTNLSHLLGVGADDVELTRAVLAVSTLCIILPLSVQRDMSNLSKTSAISVIFDCFLVGIVACFSPVAGPSYYRIPLQTFQHFSQGLVCYALLLSVSTQHLSLQHRWRNRQDLDGTW